MSKRLDTGITIDITSNNDLVVQGQTYHIKDQLKSLGLQWKGGAWRISLQSEEQGLEMLSKIQAEFPKWDEREFGWTYELIS